MLKDGTALTARPFHLKFGGVHQSSRQSTPPLPDQRDYFALRGAVCRSSPSSFFQNFARAVVPWPVVSSLPGINSTRPFFTRLISRSSKPSSGGLRSSSAELIANSTAWMRSSPADGL